MTNVKRHAASVIVAVFMLVTLTYVGSFYALIMPQGRWVFPEPLPSGEEVRPYRGYYRYGAEWASHIFWPLEQIDRRLRTYEPRPIPHVDHPGRELIPKLE